MTRVIDTLNIVLDDIIKNEGKDTKLFLNIHKE